MLSNENKRESTLRLSPFIHLLQGENLQSFSKYLPAVVPVTLNPIGLNCCTHSLNEARLASIHVCPLHLGSARRAYGPM